jgi:type 1 glutamine amidotransferase
MSHTRGISCLLLAFAASGPLARGAGPAPAADTARVYGEWRIHVRPDRGSDYDRLIAQSGLPLFRAAGGRMVGWWKTLIGDLYEHVTIWEYDNMAAFERAIGVLSKDPAFARFVASRDPLLAGEESRFLRLVAGSEPPRLPESAAFIVHEVHRVPLARKEAYLAFMTERGLDQLKSYGLHPVGPWVVDVGKWSEVTYLFPYDSLAQREQTIAALATKPDARSFLAKVHQLTDDVTSRLLVPAPFAVAAPVREASDKQTSTLPLRAELAPGVHVAGAADRFRNANCGWIALGDETLLIDIPRAVPVGDFLHLVEDSTHRPARTLVLTSAHDGDWPIVRSLVDRGITRVIATPAIKAALVPATVAADQAPLRVLTERTSIGTPETPVDYLPLDPVSTAGAAAVHLPAHGVLFAGPAVVNGPRAPLPRTDTAAWITALRRLESLAPARVVPGIGSWGAPELLPRQRRFLTELRRQVGYHIAQGRPRAALPDQVRIGPDSLVWMPYDTPTDDDLDHVYKELTVPAAPFGGPDRMLDSGPHALVLMGDGPHEPGHIEEGLAPVFEAAGVVPHFTVDVRALSADNLARVQLLVILRDGLQRPSRDASSHFAWMTPEQERAVTSFVATGGGLLNLHNALAIYPDAGPYLELLGGRYVTHGPLERFRVEVVDHDHPVTQGVRDFFIADEQHTPTCDERKVHLLLTSRADDGRSAAAGWVRETGRGRLCHLAPGHTREALLHPMFQQLLRNAVRWCLGR